MSFVTRSGSQFMLNGGRFKFIGMNYYPFLVGNETLANIKELFGLAKSRGISVFRTWCFDAGDPPTDSGGNFRFLDYPIGTNMIPNGDFESDTSGWVLSGDFTRSNADVHTGSYSIKQSSSGGYNSVQSIPLTVTANTNYVLTFWYKMSNSWGYPPITKIVDGSGANQILDGGFTYDTGGQWVRKQLLFNSGSYTSVKIQFINFSGGANGYYDTINLCVQQTPVLSWRENTFIQLDTLLDAARQYGVKLILSLADNPTYNTKKTYVNWANTINGSGLSTAFPYIGFFQSTDCKNLYKAFIDKLTSRVNTINGQTYKTDDAIFSWELGNELRTDAYEGATVNTINSDNLALLSKVGGWVDQMSTYIKSVDANHLVSFGAMEHTWQYVTGDTVSNGTFYGVDYNILSALPNIDYLDFHCYPTQGNGETQLLQYGQRLGYPNAITGTGFIAQLKDYVAVAKANGKPCICGEIGFVKEVIASTQSFPLYPRHEAFKKIFDTIFDNDGDGVMLWSATQTGGGSYSIILGDFTGTPTNLNSDDTPLMNIISRRVFQGKRIPLVCGT